jgi:hypothetical protein
MTLEVVEEGEDLVWLEIVEVQENDRSTAPVREKAEQKRDCVSVAAHRVRTGSSNTREVVCEEPTKGVGSGR